MQLQVDSMEMIADKTNNSTKRNEIKREDDLRRSLRSFRWKVADCREKDYH